MSDFYSSMYNPDVLTCLANLSNDEVFTPPEVANRMLDMLPEELWHDSSATFLDPACKSGVFLREIAKRLIEGLKEVCIVPSIPTASIPSRFLRTPAATSDTSGYRIAGRTASACFAVRPRLNMSEGTSWKPMPMSGYIRSNRRRYLR